MYHRTKIFFGLFLAWIIADLPLHAAQKNVVPPPQRILIKDRKDLRKQNRLPAAPKKIAVQKTPVKKAVPAKKPAAQTKSTTLKTYTINKNSYVDLNDAAKYYKAKLTVSGKSLRLHQRNCGDIFFCSGQKRKQALYFTDRFHQNADPRAFRQTSPAEIDENHDRSRSRRHR